MLRPAFSSQSASGARITSPGILLKGRRQRQKENSGVSIRSSSFVQIWRGSTGDTARPIPQRSKVGSVGRRLLGRGAAPRRASSHTRSRCPRRRWRWAWRRRTWWRGTWWRRPWRRGTRGGLWRGWGGRRGGGGRVRWGAPGGGEVWGQRGGGAQRGG